MSILACQSCHQEFVLTLVEEDSYRRFGFEPISECFACMHMHMLTFRNGRTLYRRTCDGTGKSILSIYAPDSPYTVFASDYWYSDKWDALDYGRDIDFSRPFFDQMKELQLDVPRMALMNVQAENSEYCNMCIGNKDCYCVFGGDYNQNVFFSVLGMHNTNCVDCDYSNHNEQCFDLFSSFHCYGSRSIVDSKNCVDCAYVSDCIGCSDCILCVNLVKKQYCINNVQLSKDEYIIRKSEMVNGQYTVHEKNMAILQRMRERRIVKYVHILSSEQCSGDFLENSKDCHNCFFVTDSQDVVNGIFVTDAKDSFLSSYFGHGTELSFHCLASIGSNRTHGCYFVTNSSELDYCDIAINSKNCFGCCNIKQKQYCILNKQYSEQEYKTLREKLIVHMQSTGEWGMFLRKDLSCFAYNEGTGHEFFPLTKENAEKQGFRWREPQEHRDAVEKVVIANLLLDDIANATDEVLQWAIHSKQSNRPFRLIKQELEFYRKNNIPLPRLHPEERFSYRFKTFTNPLVLYPRTCTKCSKDIQTTYAPERPEIVYCEECYLETVY